MNAGDWQAVVATADLVYGGTHGEFVFADPEGPLLEDPADPNAIERSKLAAFDPLTGELSSWAPHANSLIGVWALAAGDSGLVVGGNFTRVNFKPSRFVAVFPPGAAPPPIDPPPVDPPPAGQQCTAVAEAGTVHLSWTPIEGEDRWVVRRNGRWLATVDGARALTDEPGPGSHAYVIRSERGGVQTDTACPPVTVDDVDPPPAGQTCVRTGGPGGTVQLSWTAIDGEDRYIVRRNDRWVATTDVLVWNGPGQAGDDFVVRSSRAGVTTTTPCG